MRFLCRRETRAHVHEPAQPGSQADTRFTPAVPSSHPLPWYEYIAAYSADWRTEIKRSGATLKHLRWLREDIMTQGFFRGDGLSRQSR